VQCSHNPLKTRIFSTFCWLIGILPSATQATLIHEWDVGAPLASDSTWADPVGTKNLSAAPAASTSVVFTSDSRVNLNRAYTAKDGALQAGAASGLSTGTYTFELWVDFDSSLTAGEVIFESGGGSNGIGVYTTATGLEFATASTTTGSDALAAISLAGLDLTHYVQIVGICDTTNNTLTIQARDVDGVTASRSATSTEDIALGTGNSMGLFAGGNGNFSNVPGNIGGSSATGVSLPPTPNVFSGGIGLFRIWDENALAATASTHAALINQANRADDTRPNVIVIFTDDHGYADLGIQGQIPSIAGLTPNIDRLGTEGVRFTSGYITAPQCTPSRAGIISGTYQQRFGVDQNGRGPMQQSVKTIASRLRTTGYRTGMVGKWHLEPTAADAEWMGNNGYANIGAVPTSVIDSFRPQAQGFDEFAEGRQQTYWKNFNRDGTNATEPLGAHAESEGSDHRLDLQSEFATAFIDRNHDRPFFLHLAYFAPHVPLTPVDRYYNSPTFFPGEQNARRICLSMIKAMDDGVEDILAKLVEHNIDQQTIIWFIGDNGAPLGYQEAGNVGETDASWAWDGSLNNPLLGEKGMLAEGGIRVPFLMRWAGTIPPQVYDKPVISLDVGATAVILAGLTPDADIDGVNLIPHLDGSDPTEPHDCLFWRFWDQGAIRQGNWKYLEPSPSTPAMLFDLSSLRGEEDNVIGQHPDIATTLSAKLETWKSDLFRPGNLGSQLNVQETPWYERHFGVGLKFEFTTPGNNEGWTPSLITNPRVEDGQWKGEADPSAQLTQSSFLVRGASVDNLLIEITAPEDGSVTLQWAHRNDDTFSATRQLSLPIVTSPDPQWLVFPTEGEASWTDETITRVRLGFTSSNGADIEINWIRSSDGDHDTDGIADLTDGATDTDGDGNPNMTDQDSDNDSLSDQSEGSVDPDGDGTPNYLDLDSDNDHQSDRLESLLGTSPISAGEKLTASITMNGANPEVTAVPGVSSLAYRLCRSTSLAPGSWVCLEDRQPETPGNVLFTPPPPPRRRQGILSGIGLRARASSPHPSRLRSLSDRWIPDRIQCRFGFRSDTEHGDRLQRLLGCWRRHHFRHRALLRRLSLQRRLDPC